MAGGRAKTVGEHLAELPDAGRSRLRSGMPDDPLPDAIAAAVASTPVGAHIAQYEASRARK